MFLQTRSNHPPRLNKQPRNRILLPLDHKEMGNGGTISGHSRSTLVNQPPASGPGYTAHGRYGPPSSLNMGNMAYSLPGHHSQSSPFEPHLVHQYNSSPHAQAMMYSIQSMGHYPGAPGGGVPYGIPYAPAYAHYPAHQLGPAQYSSGPYYGGHSPMHNVGTNQGHVYAGSYYAHTYPGTYGPPQTGPMPQNRTQSRPASKEYPKANFNIPKKETERRGDAEYDVTKTIVDGSNPSRLTSEPSSAIEVGSLPPTSVPSTPRGPPRKPKQSGHALWVGNLPPGANVLDLKDHFSREATDDIESVFLISKSNCAFVNYKTAAACAAALTRFHDSRFHGVRLVCRLRKGFTVPGSGSTMAATTARHRMEEAEPSGEESRGVDSSTTRPEEASGHSADRYFIVKSLTVEDLELSKQSGIWATQSHNEVNLNRAFETTDNVYLIFSANKSGEYFGYARMLSPITDDEDLTLQVPPRPEPTLAGNDDLEMTPTAATATAPRGRIIDDSARGTIFWEVESSEGENDEVRSEKSVEAPDDSEIEPQSFGKPFRIEWQSTERVPFHRTRGLRNPWNANREVKIARDGTEIEPTVGRKLVQLFHQS
ncbi:Nucleotide-binding alpha-beta plait [Penicillium chermesinum]|nr:Nucleotide-binding alpha-beta plait [Penicillium chermesinum]